MDAVRLTQFGSRRGDHERQRRFLLGSNGDAVERHALFLSLSNALPQFVHGLPRSTTTKAGHSNRIDRIRDKLTATRRHLGNVAGLVDDGAVCLRGPVPSYHLRQMAIERAKRVPGVRLVTDEMQVADA